MKGWRTIVTVKSWANKKVLSTVPLLKFGRAGALSYHYYYYYYYYHYYYYYYYYYYYHYHK